MYKSTPVTKAMDENIQSRIGWGIFGLMTVGLVPYLLDSQVSIMIVTVLAIGSLYIAIKGID